MEPENTTWVDPLELAGVPDAFQRLWVPHRVSYIRGDNRPQDKTDQGQCPFCLGPSLDDADSLIVYRGEKAFVICNLYPYNSGHLLVVPYRHISTWDQASSEERFEIGELSAKAMRVLKKVSRAQGFNLGMNQGEVAGAGIAGHLHQHIVPRYMGDANFFPLIARTKAMPYLLSQTRQMLAAGWAQMSADGSIDSSESPEVPLSSTGTHPQNADANSSNKQAKNSEN